MELLKELLNEYLGASRGRQDEIIWRQQAGQRAHALAGQEGMDYWIVTKQGKKYGPFPNQARAQMFFRSRLDIPRDSRMLPAPKNTRM